MGGGGFGNPSGGYGLGGSQNNSFGVNPGLGGPPGTGGAGLGAPPQNTGPFQGRDEFGRIGPFAGRNAQGFYHQGNPGQPQGQLGQGGPAQLKGGVGSADWISTHPNFQAPSQGVGSMDWLKTHPNFGNPQQGQPQQYGGLGGPAPLQQGQPDMMTALMRMFGGGGGYGNQMMF